ncbi:MAG: site-specific integrase [Ignavibacterium sp.]|nr:site-specific integrase [Ignavibacterium sp.]
MNEFNFDYEQFVKEMIKQMPGNITGVDLQTFVNEYLAFTEKNRAKKSYEGVKLVNKKILAYFSPIRKLDTIQLKDAEQFLDVHKRTAPKGVYNYYRTLRAQWNKARQWNYVKENPFEKIKLKKRQNQKPVYVTEKQLDEIIKHIDSEVVKDAVITAFYSGCRLGEIVNLTWQDVKLNDDYMLIGNKDFETKGRKQRIVPIHQNVKGILVRRFPKMVKREKHYVFGKGNCYPFTGDYFSRKFKSACRQAGIDEEIHFHCLRHGAATTMIMNGAPLPAVQKILGHSNIQTTMIYTHPDLESLREAVNRL